MKYLLISENGNFNNSALSKLTKDDSLTILIPVKRDTLASEFEKDMKRYMKEAESLQEQLLKKEIHSKVLVEWGDKKEAISLCLAREEAVVLE